MYLRPLKTGNLIYFRDNRLSARDSAIESSLLESCSYRIYTVRKIYLNRNSISARSPTFFRIIYLFNNLIHLLIGNRRESAGTFLRRKRVIYCITDFCSADSELLADGGN
jgi:hypothetical protein